MFSKKLLFSCVLGAMLATTVVAEAKNVKIRETVTSPLPGIDVDGNLFEGDGEGDVKVFARINKKGKGRFHVSGKGKAENETGKRQVVRNSPLAESFAEMIAGDILDDNNLSLDTFNLKRSVLVFRKPTNQKSKVRLSAAGSFTTN